MGLTIYYRGTLLHPDAVESLIEDVMDICHEIGWRYHPIHRSNIMPAEGLFITPEGSESIDLTFLPNGNLYNCIHFLYTRHPENEVVDEEKHKWISTKTNYAGADAHMAIIKFFRYLNQKYFKDFEMIDESQYWETNDISTCMLHFGESTEAKEMINKAMGMMGYDPVEEDPEEEDDDEYMSENMDEILLKRRGFEISLN